MLAYSFCRLTETLSKGYYALLGFFCGEESSYLLRGEKEPSRRYLAKNPTIITKSTKVTRATWVETHETQVPGDLLQLKSLRDVAWLSSGVVRVFWGRRGVLVQSFGGGSLETPFDFRQKTQNFCQQILLNTKSWSHLSVYGTLYVTCKVPLLQ